MKKYLIGSAIVLSLIAVSAPSANALTQAEASAIISALSLNAAQAAAIQALVTAPAAVTAAPTFTRSLTVGSSGSDVTALQQWLVANGYLTMPAGTAYGYFGSLTKNAVAAYQAHEGISPAAGYFGPITIAHLSAMSAGTPSTPVTGGTVMCPVGYTCAPTTGSTGTTGGTVALDNTDGSITASYSSYVSSSQTLKKGDTKDLIAVKLQATAGKVAVNRFDVHFTERPWLDFASVTLKDSSGNVIATKNLSSAADATEISVGTDYLVRFDNVNYVVTPGTDAILVVSGTVLSNTDKITGQHVGISIPNGSIRTINGRGYTDSLGLGSDTAINGTNVNNVQLSSTGSTGDIYSRVSPNTPATRIVTTSTSQTTSNVVLGVFSLKSQNQNSTINSLQFNINNSTGAATTTVFSNIRLVDSATGATYGVNSTNAGGTTFTNLTIALPQDQWKDLTLQADVNSNQSGIVASSTLVAAGIVGIDSNYNTVTISNASNATSNNVTLLTSGIAVTNPTATLGTAITNSNTTVGYNINYSFTVTNTSNNDVFISKTPGIALGTSTAGSSNAGATASSTLTYVTANPSTYAGDTTDSFDIPAGVSRTFTYTGVLNNTNGPSGLRVFKITQINFGTGSTNGTNNTSNISFGLENLVLTPSF